MTHLWYPNSPTSASTHAYICNGIILRNLRRLCTDASPTGHSSSSPPVHRTYIKCAIYLCSRLNDTTVMSANPPSLTPRQQEDAAASERRTPIGQRIIGPLLETLVSAWKRIKEPFCGFESGNEANYRRGLGRLPPSFGTRPNYDPLETMDVFWEHYRTEAEAADNELVKALGSDLDTLLIFVRLLV